jgi:NADP-dependent 3-hydroxy acid dehydrogenase YdfG
MPTIAVVGAGPGLGLSIGRVFGAHGFDVALVARSARHVDALAEELRAAGTRAVGFAADVAERAELRHALQLATEHFGSIDVLEYSPYAGLTTILPQAVTVDDLAPEIEQLLYGAVTAAQAVLPDMLRRGSGTLLFTTGGGAITPYPTLSTVNAAQAALRNWALNLHGAVADQGVHVATVAINVLIGATAPPGVPHRSPDDIASVYWELHERRSDADALVGADPAQRTS